jgi:hypothetical protein
MGVVSVPISGAVSGCATPAVNPIPVVGELVMDEWGEGGVDYLFSSRVKWYDRYAVQLGINGFRSSWQWT